jgi:hypothetical protein
MNKAGSRTATRNQSGKMANRNGYFHHRDYTVLRFSAPAAPPACHAEICNRAKSLPARLMRIFSRRKTKNHRQGIAGGFGGLASK